MTVTLGVPKVKPEVTAHYALFLTGRTLKGSLFGGWKPKSDLPSLVDMYLREVRAKLILLFFGYVISLSYLRPYGYVFICVTSFLCYSMIFHV